MLFTSEGRREQEADRWIGAVIQMHHWAVMVKRAKCKNELIYGPIYILAELWVVGIRMRMWIREGERERELQPTGVCSTLKGASKRFRHLTRMPPR